MYTKRKPKTLSVIPTNTNEKGIVLVGTIALVAILAVFGTLGIVTTSTELIISKNHKTSVQARYVAEAGIHRTIGMINSSPGWLEGLDPDPEINPFSDNSFGNGTYVVKVYKDDPVPGKVKIITTGDVNGSSSTFEAIVTPEYYEIFDFASFDCGTISLQGTDTNVISGDVFVTGDINLEASGLQQIQNGNAYAIGDIIIKGTSSITGGSAFSNGTIDLESSASPYIIDGSAEAKGPVDGDWSKVSGTVSDFASPDPVENKCDVNILGGITLTEDVIQGFRNDPDTLTIVGNYEFESTDNLSGIVHITQDFELTVDSTFSANLILIVGRNVDISAKLESTNGTMVTFLVPDGDFTVQGGGDVEIDGTLLVGTVVVDQYGIVTSKSGGNIDVKDNSHLTVNGSVLAVNGNTDALLGGSFVVNYESTTDSNFIKPSSYAMTQWREVRN